MKKLLVLSMLSVFSVSSAAYACDGMKDHKASDKSSQGDSPSAKKETKGAKKDPTNKS